MTSASRGSQTSLHKIPQEYTNVKALIGVKFCVTIILNKIQSNLSSVFLHFYSKSLCILIARPRILNAVYVFLLLSMYSYCSSMYS